MADPDEGDPLALDNQLCFSLYTASRALTGLYRELLGELGLTYPQYLVMLVLWEHGTLTVKELSLALHLDSGTLSPLLRRLEASGLVIRERSTSDERVVRVTATAAGLDLRERATDIPGRLVCATDLTATAARDLRDALGRLTLSVETAARRRAACDTADATGTRPPHR